MVGTRQLHRLIDHTAKVGAKLVLVGDPKQLAEIEAGGLFASLARRLGHAELTENRRVTSQVCSRGKRDWSATVRAEGCKTGVWTRMCGLRSWKRRTGCCGSG